MQRLARSAVSRRQVMAGLAAGLTLTGPSRAQAPLLVVASFSILADLVRQASGPRVGVVSLVGPGADVHVYDPTPDAAQKLAAARLVVINGLGLEGWIERLVRSAGAKAPIVTASDGITPRTIQIRGETRVVDDPHAWQSVANAKIYVTNIARGLAAADPDGAEAYADATAHYLAQLDDLDRDIRAAIASIPPDRRKIITTHDAFGYFGAAYGIEFIAPNGISTETEASARDVAAIIRQIRAEKIPAVFLENVTDPRLARQIAAESGARVGGTLYADALSPPDGPAGTYIDMVRHNIRELVKALSA